MRKNLVEILVPLAALLLAGCAAVFSVLGLSKLFGGNTQAIIIMASILEFSKLITASITHNYRKKFSFLLKSYLTFVVVVLVVITSMGVYGFLINAYQQTSDQLEIVNSKVSSLEIKKKNYQNRLDILQKENNELPQTILKLSQGLSENKIQYVDSTGRIITTQSSRTRNVLRTQLEQTRQRQKQIESQIDLLMDSITTINTRIYEIKNSTNVFTEVGPLRYLSELTGKNMDDVVNVLALILVLVFDPLAITLVIVSNKIFVNPNKNPSDLREFLEKTYSKIEEDIPEPIKQNLNKEEIIEETIQKIEKPPQEPTQNIDDLMEVYRNVKRPKSTPKTQHYPTPNDKDTKKMIRNLTN